MARSLYKEAKTSLIAIKILSIPRILRKVSCWPANEASGKSSAVADERTATAMSSPWLISAKASRISCSRSLGNSCSIIMSRIFLPVAVNAATSSTSRPWSASLILSWRPVPIKNLLKASDVVAKPPGTLTPKSVRWLIISPNEAFLPPTLSMSFLPNLSSEITCAFKVITPWNKDYFEKIITVFRRKFILKNDFLAKNL